MSKNGKMRTRANNGMGSIRLRSDGRWEARYTTPDNQQKSIYGKTEKEVSVKLRGLLHDIDTGAWRAPSRITVAGWMSTWLRDYQSHTTERTIKTYTIISKNRIVPIIGKVRLSSLTIAHIHKVVADMKKQNLSTAYIKQCVTIMSAAFNAAVESGIIRSNPAANIKIQRGVKKKLNIVDRDLFPDFIFACKKRKYGLAILYLLLTGLRAGEERGLCWSDIDFDASRMDVSRQIPMTGKTAFFPPKDNSIRTIELPPEAIELLRQQRKNITAMRLLAGSEWHDDDITKDLVFRSPYGNVLNRTTLYNTVKAVGSEIGLPDLHPHDLRHSYAVAALRSGIDVKTVQNNMGHKNAAITLDTYAAYTKDAGRAGAVKFSSYWQDALK